MWAEDTNKQDDVCLDFFPTKNINGPLNSKKEYLPKDRRFVFSENISAKSLK